MLYRHHKKYNCPQGQDLPQEVNKDQHRCLCKRTDLVENCFMRPDLYVGGFEITYWKLMGHVLGCGNSRGIEEV